ncbi:MAG: hypothetical protein KDA41_05210, partial [Planctomycetales bacterium]|nr:hypothetical protein [Planctomycetales bacterium]
PMFRRVRHEERETELLVLVTPRLAHPLDDHERPLRLPGMETCSPNDAQFFWDGRLEVPTECSECCSDDTPWRGHSYFTPRGAPPAARTFQTPRSAQLRRLPSVDSRSYSR